MTIPLLEDAATHRAMRRSSRATLSFAWAHVRDVCGALGAVRIFAGVALAQRRGEPFGTLGPAADRRDALSRTQLAPAVLLYRALQNRSVPRARALEVVHAVVQHGGIAFLSEMLGGLGDGEPLSASALRPTILATASRFFNAEGSLHLPSDSEVEFNVTRCRFVELLRHVGHPELGPAFCEVDQAYFVAGHTPIQLERTKTLMTGGDGCDFRFKV